ncbi:MAG: hypothetical protein WCK89_22875 [bacterium]
MKSTRVIAVVLSLALGAFTSYAAVTVTNVTARMRPNNFQYVDIAYDLLNSSNELHDVVVEVYRHQFFWTRNSRIE